MSVEATALVAWVVGVLVVVVRTMLLIKRDIERD